MECVRQSRSADLGRMPCHGASGVMEVVSAWLQSLACSARFPGVHRRSANQPTGTLSIVLCGTLRPRSEGLWLWVYGAFVC